MGLSELGLSAAQERCYRALVADPELTPAALASKAVLTAGELNIVIDDLRELRLLVDGDAPTGAVARRPGIALAELADRQTRSLTRRLRDVAETQTEINALDQLTHRHRVPPTPDVNVVEVLHGRPAVQAKLDELAWTSRTSVDSAQPGPLLPPSVSRGSGLSRSLHRGLRIRWIVDHAVVDNIDHRRALIDDIRTGVEIRVANRPIDRLLIVDSTVAVVPVDLHNRDAGALLVRQPVLLSSLQAVFDRAWDTASPLTVDGVGIAATPDVAAAAQDGELLAALTAHATDEAAARDLAISVRHLRRRTARAFLVLGARNRFHAGVLAQRYGLLDPAASGPDETSRTGHPEFPTDA